MKGFISACNSQVILYLRDVGARNLKRELKQRQESMEDVLTGLLSLLYIIQDYLNRGGTAHCGLGSSISQQLLNKKMPPQECLRDIFSGKILSSQIQLCHTDI